MNGNSQYNYNTNVQTDFSNENNHANNGNKLIRFKYTVRDQNNEIIESYFDAENAIDVESFLLNKGYQIVSIEEDKVSTKLGLAALAISKKMSLKDLNFFLTQLSTYVKSGISLVDSMEILSRQVRSTNLKMLYRKIVFELNRGVPFSNCLSKQGKVFPSMLINMVKTSEMTGDLTGVLDDMAIYYKRQDSNRKQIVSAMLYPSVLLIFAIAVLTFVIMYVVPQFTDMYATAGADLPGITVAVINVSNFFVANWFFMLLGILTVVIALTIAYKKVTSVKYIMQFLVMHIPVVKDIIIFNELVTFTSTFSALIRHDVFITDSMQILRIITENEIYKEIIRGAIDNLSRGNGVSIAFKGKWAFPETAYEMLVTGERTGKLGEMMEHVSQFYQEEQENITTRLKSLIEPLMIILLAVLVGIILLAIVVPMFGIYSEVI